MPGINVSASTAKLEKGIVLSTGNIWYVDAAMGASGDGKSPSNAFKTIQEAVNAASSGDVIKIKGGGYDENADARGLVIEKNSLTLIGDEPFQVQITNSNGASTSTIYLNADYCRFENMLTSGIGFGSGSTVGWYLDSGSDYNVFIKCAAAGHTSLGISCHGSVNKFDTCLSVFNISGGVDYEIRGGSFHQFINCISIGFDLGSLDGVGFKIDSGSVSYNIMKNCSSIAKAYGFYIYSTYALITNCSAGGCTTNLYVDPASYNSVIVDFNEDSYITAYNTLQQDLFALYGDTKFLYTTALDGSEVDGSIGDYVKTDIYTNNVKYIESSALPSEPTPESLNYISKEIETHLHSYERWYELTSGAITDAHCAERIGHASGVGPFRIDAGNSSWGSWVQLLGTSDTPAVSGADYYDFHRIEVTASESNNPYFIQFAFGSSGAGAIVDNTYTSVVYKPQTAVSDAPIMIQTDRHAIGTRAWARCMVRNTNTATLDFYFGIHEYNFG